MWQTNPTVLALLLCAATLTAQAAGPDNRIERGKYLVSITGCHDCHTPLTMGENGPVPDFARALSGHPQPMALPPAPAGQGPWIWGGAATNTAFWGPWGISYATNITSDRETGIGMWKADDFVKAMKTGKHLGVGRPILPPMPWPALSSMTEDDLRAMFAYLQGTPPVANKVPEAMLAPPPK